jgi:hypothetical protein
MTTTLPSLSEMTTEQLESLLESLTESQDEQWRLMQTTPQGTTAWEAMDQSRPGLWRFRMRIDDELYRRGV